MIENCDALEFLRSLESASVDLIATDPPYYKAINEDWDHQWLSEADFLVWLEKILIEFKRVLRLTGSLYLFASPRMAAKVELLIDKHFRVLNHIVWLKGLDNGQGPWSKASKERLTVYHPRTERIIFAESCQAQQSRNQQKHALRRQIFAPLIEYFGKARLESDLTSSQICEQMDTLTGVKYSFQRHTLETAQWRFPIEEQYRAAQTFLPLSRSYEELRAEYEGLKQKLDISTRFFEAELNNFLYTDVWRFNHLPAGSKKRRHPTQKPLKLMKHIIQTSSRPGDVVLDPFAGSGTTLVAAKQLERKRLGCELDEEYYLVACKRLGEVEKVKEVSAKAQNQKWQQLILI